MKDKIVKPNANPADSNIFLGDALVSEEIAMEIMRLLNEMYPESECELQFIDIFQLIISVILSAQTTDRSVNAVTPALFSRYPTACDLAGAEQMDVEDIIRVIGMYKTKSKNIIATAKIICEQYNGEVPSTYDELVKLPGVGRKTANVVLSVGFGEQRIAVDTHVFRVSNRIGLVREKDVLETEKALMDLLPEDTWSRSHHILIFHGRYCCKARRPECEKCDIADYCKYPNKTI